MIPVWKQSTPGGKWPVAGLPLFFAVLWVVLMIGRGSAFFADGATFRHVRTGAEILMERGVPVLDRFSVAAFGESWSSSSWLGDVILAVLDRIGGETALAMGSSTLLAMLFTWVFLRFLRAGVHPLFGVSSVLLALSAAWPVVLARPALFDLVAITLLAGLLASIEAGRAELRELSSAIPLFLIWSNVSDGAVGGFSSLAFVVLGWMANPLFAGVAQHPVGRISPVSGDGRKQFPLLVGLSAAIALTALISPYGFSWLLAWPGLTQSPVVQAAEGLAVSGAGVSTMSVTLARWSVVVLAVFHLGSLAAWGRGFSPVRTLPLVWLALGWLDARHLPWFALCAVVILAEGLGKQPPEAAETSPGKGDVPVESASLETDRIPDFLQTGMRCTTVAAVLILTLGLGLQAWGVASPLIGKHAIRLDERIWPVALIPRINAWASGKPPGEAIFNDLRFGGFLIGHVRRARVFIDDRWNLYQEKRLADFTAASRDPAPLERWERGFQFTGALVIPGTPFDRWFRGRTGWRLVGETPIAAWFEKN